MKNEREIAELIFDKFRNSNCKTNEVVPFHSIRFGLIGSFNPKEKELFDKVFIGLQALDYFHYEKDGLESIRLTQKGYDYIYDYEQVELISKKPWVIPQHDTTDWNKAFNVAWKVINESGSPYYLSQTPFYNLVRKINDSLPPYANYLTQREKVGKSRTREYVYYDLINELPVEKRFEFYVTLQEHIENTNLEKEKPNDDIDFSHWDTPSPVPIEEVQKTIPVIPEVVEEAPKVFISYSWDTSEHEEWVLNLATKLRGNGVDVILDKWDLGKYGKLLPNFMEQSITKSQRVICVMTPNYKKKTDKLEGGVGYEYSIITGQIFNADINTSKFIPLFREGTKDNAIPTSFTVRNYVDMRKNDEFDAKFEDLLRDIHDAPRYKKPAIGPKPKFD